MEFPEELTKKAEELKIDVSKYEDEDALRDAVEASEKTKKKDDDKNKTEHEIYLDKELKKVIGQRDEEKKERRKLSDKIKDLETKLSSAPSDDEIKTLKEQLQELKEFKDTIDSKREEEEDKKRTETERQLIAQQKDFEKTKTLLEEQLEKFQAQLDKRDEELKKQTDQVKSLRYFRLENEIAQYALTYEAINPRQIVRLIKDDAVYDENLDKFYYPVFDNKGKMINELTIEEKVKEFLEDSENENLVKSKVNTDSMHTKKSDGDKAPPDFGSYDPKDPKLIQEAQDRRLTIEDWIAIKIKKDEKLQKIKEKQSK